MYTRPAATVGLASSSGAGLPVITGGCQCHTWAAEAAFAGVNAVAGLTELCCGPCRYCGQSRFAVPGPAAAVTVAWDSSTAPTRPDIPIRLQAPAKRRILDIPSPSSVPANNSPSMTRPAAPGHPVGCETALPALGIN